MHLVGIASMRASCMPLIEAHRCVPNHDCAGLSGIRHAARRVLCGTHSALGACIVLHGARCTLLAVRAYGRVLQIELRPERAHIGALLHARLITPG